MQIDVWFWLYGKVSISDSETECLFITGAFTQNLLFFPPLKPILDTYFKHHQKYGE